MDSDSTANRGVGSPLEAARPRRLRLALGVAVVVAGVLLSEVLLFAGLTWPAIWGHLLVLVGCIGWLQWGEERPVVQVLALVPLFRLVNLGMPVFFQLTVYWFPLVYGPLVPALVYVDGLENSVEVPFGVLRGLLFVPLALLVGASLAAVEWTILQPAALVPTWSIGQVLMITVVMVCFVGFVEEYLFRGLLQGTVQREFGRIPGLLLASGVFGVMHSGYGLPEEMLFAAVIGLVFGVLYDVFESLTLVTLVHGFLNVFLFAVYPLHGVPFV